MPAPQCHSLSTSNIHFNNFVHKIRDKLKLKQVSTPRKPTNKTKQKEKNLKHKQEELILHQYHRKCKYYHKQNVFLNYTNLIHSIITQYSF